MLNSIPNVLNRLGNRAGVEQMLEPTSDSRGIHFNKVIGPRCALGIGP